MTLAIILYFPASNNIKGKVFVMIDFVHVVKTYPNGTVALNDITLHIDDGEFVFVVGASGAGKTTLMKLILREEKVTSGKIIVDDVDITKLSYFKVPHYRRNLGVVFQDFRLFPKKTIYENVAFAMQVVGTPMKVIKGEFRHCLRPSTLAKSQSAFRMSYLAANSSGWR